MQQPSAEACGAETTKVLTSMRLPEGVPNANVSGAA
jgi:hypothetical protein